MPCERFISIPSPFPPDASSCLPNSPTVTTQQVSRYCHLSPERQNAPPPARLRATGPLDKYLLGAQGLWSKARFCSRLAICPWTKYNSTFYTRALHFLGCKIGRKLLLIRESPLSARREENKDAESSTGRPASALLPEWELHPLLPREAMGTPRSTPQAHARKPNQPPQEGTSPPTGAQRVTGGWPGAASGREHSLVHSPPAGQPPPVHQAPAVGAPHPQTGARRSPSPSDAPNSAQGRAPAEAPHPPQDPAPSRGVGPGPTSAPPPPPPGPSPTPRPRFSTLSRVLHS